MSNTTPSGADALDVAMSKACIHSWDQSQFTSGDCDAVHPMFSRAFEAGYRAALAAQAQKAAPAAQQPLTDEQIAKALGFGEYTVEFTKATLTEVTRAIEQAHGIGARMTDTLKPNSTFWSTR